MASARERRRVLSNWLASAGMMAILGGLVGVSPAGATVPEPPSSEKTVGNDASRAGQTGTVGFTSTVMPGILSPLYANGAGFQGNNFAAAEWDSLDPSVLGYSKRKSGRHPLYHVPKNAPPSNVKYAVWGQVYVDREWRDQIFQGVDLGRNTTTVGGLFGIDAVITGLRSQTDALVLGVLAGDMSSNTRNNDGSSSKVNGPSVGAYVAYVYGSVSIDAVYKVDFLTLKRTAVGGAVTTVGLDNNTFAINFNHRVTMPGWWFEPTVGASVTHLTWDSRGTALGFESGNELRLQGGVRAGTTWQWDKIQVEPTATAMAYSPVQIQGGTIAGGAAVPNDAGKLFGQFIGKLNFIWSTYLSSYVEGEVRGGNEVLAAAGRIGARYNLNP
jgi:hypothetical protein